MKRQHINGTIMVALLSLSLILAPLAAAEKKQTAYGGKQLLADTTGSGSDGERAGLTEKTITIGSCLPLSYPLRPRGLTMSHGETHIFPISTTARSSW